jgi:hypothetical protein
LVCYQELGSSGFKKIDDLKIANIFRICNSPRRKKFSISFSPEQQQRSCLIIDEQNIENTVAVGIAEFDSMGIRNHDSRKRLVRQHECTVAPPECDEHFHGISVVGEKKDIVVPVIVEIAGSHDRG